jgi:hypothetical protein
MFIVPMFIALASVSPAQPTAIGLLPASYCGEIRPSATHLLAAQQVVHHIELGTKTGCLGIYDVM